MFISLSNLKEVLVVKRGRQCIRSNFSTQSSVLSSEINAKYLVRENFISVVDHLFTRY